MKTRTIKMFSMDQSKLSEIFFRNSYIDRRSDGCFCASVKTLERTFQVHLSEKCSKNCSQLFLFSAYTNSRAKLFSNKNRYHATLHRFPYLPTKPPGILPSTLTVHQPLSMKDKLRPHNIAKSKVVPVSVRSTRAKRPSGEPFR